MEAPVTRSLLAALPVFLFACTGPDEGPGEPTAATVLDPAAPFAGESLSERAADWWGWIYSIPTATNPAVDETGEDCDTAQTDDVFYLAGTFGGPANRKCTFAAGRPVLLPLLNVSWDNCGVDEAYVLPDADLAPAAEAFVDGAQTMTLTIDGESVGATVADFAAHRVDVVEHSYEIPAEGSLYEYFGLDYSGTCGPSFSAGYYALVDVPAGEHDLVLTASTADFDIDITYALTVE
jgi:hypothetical protein